MTGGFTASAAPQRAVPGRGVPGRRVPGPPLAVRPLAPLTLLLLLLGGCELLAPPPQAPWTILDARFYRSRAGYTQELKITIGGEEGPPAGTAAVRFELTVTLPPTGEGEEPEHLEGSFTATGTSTPRGDGTAEISIVLDTPFGFLPREPARISALVVTELTGADGATWRGELSYPYPLTEELNSATLSKSYTLQ